MNFMGRPPAAGAPPGRKKPNLPAPLPFANFMSAQKQAPPPISKFVDPLGNLNFAGKAILSSEGVDFKGGSSYKINLSELVILEELGKGQYGVVSKAYHKPTNVIMAMKEIRLEVSDTAMKQILMELEILHKARNPYIVDFYGAFFMEGCVYYCMEFMDVGSLDKVYGTGVTEPVLSCLAAGIVHGLKFLKEELQIIHRDVKPTNVLVNTKGEVKLCDFGVSGNLIQSMAKTNIGCQSYMAPERISYSEQATYTVQSDVWSLGLSLLEIALGMYPYPADKYDSVFAQLSAIVDGVPPSLPEEGFSADCRDFVGKCLSKEPRDRPTYGELLEHPFITSNDKGRESKEMMAEWATRAVEWRKQNEKKLIGKG